MFNQTAEPQPTLTDWYRERKEALFAAHGAAPIIVYRLPNGDVACLIGSAGQNRDDFYGDNEQFLDDNNIDRVMARVLGEHEGFLSRPRHVLTSATTSANPPTEAAKKHS